MEVLIYIFLIILNTFYVFIFHPCIFFGSIHSDFLHQPLGPAVLLPLTIRPRRGATLRQLAMPTQRFKTTINCANCLRAVTPALNAEPAITAWQVDTTTPDKVLSVDTSLTPSQVAALVEEAGFKAEPLLA